MKTDAERYAENARNLLLGTFTPEQILDELVKRKGVVSKTTGIDGWRIQSLGEGGWGKYGDGVATIIVVRKQP